MGNEVQTIIPIYRDKNGNLTNENGVPISEVIRDINVREAYERAMKGVV